jgi:hypothetical protein
VDARERPRVPRTPAKPLELGRDLALLHSRVSEDPGLLAQLHTLRPPDPRPLVERRAAQGYFTPPPSPDGTLAWGLATVSRLLGLMRFFHESPGTRWTSLIA